MSQEEMDSIVMRLPNDVIFPLSMPQRIITNPIDETQEIEPEDHSLRFLKDDEFMEEYFETLASGPRFYLDTEGFDNISRLHVGYPMIYYSPDDENMVSVRIHVAIEKDIEAKTLIEKLDKIDVNDHPVIKINDVKMELDPVTIDVLRDGVYIPEP